MTTNMTPKQERDIMKQAPLPALHTTVTTTRKTYYYLIDGKLVRKNQPIKHLIRPYQHNPHV